MNYIFTGYEILAILIIHFIADFVMQTHWQAMNKSKNNIALISHTATYSFYVFLGMCLMNYSYFIDLDKNQMFYGIYYAIIFTGTSFIIHSCQDYLTSRWTSKLYAKGDFHNFFVVIGFDQVLHYVQLFITYEFLYH